MAGEAYDKLIKTDWGLIPDIPWLIKYSFHEDGYILMFTDLAAVYGEKLDVKAVQERFQILNPYAEMLPKVILKHIEHSAKSICPDQPMINSRTELKITVESSKVIIQFQFNTSASRFIFNFEPQKLSDNQFKAHVLRPALLRALVLDEEKSTLLKKSEALEGIASSSTSRTDDFRNNRIFHGNSERRKVIYSQIQENPSGPGLIEAFLYLQKDTIKLLKDELPTVSQKKRIHSNTSSQSHMKTKNSKSKPRNILYDEGISGMNLKSQNKIQQSEESGISLNKEKIEEDESSNSSIDLESQNGVPEKPNISLKMEQNEENESKEPGISVKIEEMEDCESSMNEFNHSSSNLSVKNQEKVSRTAPYLKPSPSKKKKVLKF